MGSVSAHAHPCTHRREHSRRSRPQEFTPCDHTSTWAPPSVWAPLVRPASGRAQPRVHTPLQGGPCPQPAGLRAQGSRGPSPIPALTSPQASRCPGQLAPPGPHQPVSVLQTDFEKDVDLACRSGERLTGERTGGLAGPTCFFFSSSSICPSIRLSSSHPRLAQPLPATEELLPGARPEQGTRASGSGRAQTLLAPAPHTPSPPTEAAGRVWGQRRPGPQHPQLCSLGPPPPPRGQ